MTTVAQFVTDNIVNFRWMHRSATQCDPAVWIGHPLRNGRVHDARTVEVYPDQIVIRDRNGLLMWSKQGKFGHLFATISEIEKLRSEHIVSEEETRMVQDLDAATRGMYKPKS